MKFVSMQKTAGLDSVSEWVLKLCADQLASVFTFNLSLAPSFCHTHMLLEYKSKLYKKKTTTQWHLCLDELHEQVVKDYIYSLSRTLNPLCLLFQPIKRRCHNTHYHILSGQEMVQYKIMTIVQHLTS